MWEVQKTAVDGLLLLTPRIFSDPRGHFLETFNVEAFNDATGLEINFVQDNESLSKKNVLRGLHFQAGQYAQGKLVRVVQGAVLDVAVDIRKNSSTFGQHVSVRLDGTSKQMFWIPPGFAHGFVALENDTVFAYKCSTQYNKAAERTIQWNDADLAIDWGVSDPIVSDKDAIGTPFNGNWE